MRPSPDKARAAPAKGGPLPMGRWLPTGVNGDKCVFIGDAAPMADQKYARQMSNVNVCEFVRSRKVTVDDLAGGVAG